MTNLERLRHWIYEGQYGRAHAMCDGPMAFDYFWQHFDQLDPCPIRIRSDWVARVFVTTHSERVAVSPERSWPCPPDARGGSILPIPWSRTGRMRYDVLVGGMPAGTLLSARVGRSWSPWERPGLSYGYNLFSGDAKDMVLVTDRQWLQSVFHRWFPHMPQTNSEIVAAYHKTLEDPSYNVRTALP